MVLLGLKNAEKDDYKVSQEEYDKDLKDYYTMYNLEPEAASRIISFDYYEANGYAAYYRNKIKEYYKERYQEV